MCLFALKTKDAVAVVYRMTTELHCRWGIPEIVVSDRGGKFRNRHMKRMNHVFKVNRIATTHFISEEQWAGRELQ